MVYNCKLVYTLSERARLGSLATSRLVSIRGFVVFAISIHFWKGVRSRTYSGQRWRYIQSQFGVQFQTSTCKMEPQSWHNCKIQGHLQLVGSIWSLESGFLMYVEEVRTPDTIPNRDTVPPVCGPKTWLLLVEVREQIVPTLLKFYEETFRHPAVHILVEDLEEILELLTNGPADPTSSEWIEWLSGVVRLWQSNLLLVGWTCKIQRVLPPGVQFDDMLQSIKIPAPTTVTRQLKKSDQLQFLRSGTSVELKWISSMHPNQRRWHCGPHDGILQSHGRLEGIHARHRYVDKRGKTKTQHVRTQEPITHTSNERETSVCKFVYPHVGCGFKFHTRRQYAGSH